MDIIEGIRRWIAYQKNIGEDVKAAAFAMYPHQYQSLCRQLIARGAGRCIQDRAFSVDGIVIGFYQAGPSILERVKILEHDTIFNNIIYKP